MKVVIKKNIGAYQSGRVLSIPLPTAAATRRLGARLARQAGWPRLWLLRGPLGAGKTTLVRGAVTMLSRRTRVTSPTFTLVNQYRLTSGLLLHVDAYRLRRPAEFESLGVREMIGQPGVFVAIEWPGRVRHLPTKNLLDIRLGHRAGQRVAKIICR